MLLIRKRLAGDFWTVVQKYKCPFFRISEQSADTTGGTPDAAGPACGRNFGEMWVQSRVLFFRSFQKGQRLRAAEYIKKHFK